MTQFEYACFISYRNSYRNDGVISSFARELSDAISRYFERHQYYDISRAENDHIIFLDENVIKVNGFLPRDLGQGLSKSICWIIIFTPSYLQGSLWCASELHGMLALQENRERLLQFGQNEHRFILPILFGGDTSDLPDILRSHILTDKFKKFTLLTKNIAEHPDFIPYIEEIVLAIAKKQKILVEKCRENTIDLLHVHKDFVLKDINNPIEKAEIAAFIDSIKSPKAPAFPIA